MKILKWTLSCVSLLTLSACPVEPPDFPEPIPYPTPDFTPTPSPSPFPVPSATPACLPGVCGAGNTLLPPFQVTELENGDLVADSFKLEFGPGSKGVKLEFGPGTKGPRTDFGPGSKGPKNLTFNVNFPPLLLNPNVDFFATKQLAIGGLLLQELSLEIVRDNQLYATATALPRRSDFQVAARFHPGNYTVAVIATTSNGPLQMSWNQIEILPDFNAELKVSIFGEETVKPEDLDIEVLSRNRIPREDISETEALPTPEPTETLEP